MSFQLRLREVSPTFAHQPQGSNSDENSQQWEVEAATRLGSVRTRLKDPFGRSTELGEKAEGEVRWFLERYANEPFETTRADLAAESLSNYGRDLAAQIAETGQLPKYGDIHLEIASGGPGGSRTDSSRSRRTLQQLHWEVLEDARVWPSGYSFNSISVIRSVIRTGGQEEIVAGYSMKRKFKILLVVSRPGQQSDVDYQLVSRSLVTIIDDVAKNRPDPVVSLKVLRPPTWEAFQMDLHENNYDLVHFDMRGQIRKSFEGHAVYVKVAKNPPLFLLSRCSDASFTELFSNSPSPIISILSRWQKIFELGMRSVRSLPKRVSRLSSLTPVNPRDLMPPVLRAIWPKFSWATEFNTCSRWPTKSWKKLSSYS